LRHLELSIRTLPISLLVCGLSFAPVAFGDTTKTETETTVTNKKQHHKAAETAKETATKRGDSAPAEAVSADNTGTNKRDRDDRAVTADQQKNSKSDVELAAEIRRAIVADKTLSTNAHNIKVIVQDGKVTLKGPVASKDEKATLERKAGEVLGHGRGRITSEIDVAP